MKLAGCIRGSLGASTFIARNCARLIRVGHAPMRAASTGDPDVLTMLKNLATGQATLLTKVDGLVTDVATLKTGQATLVTKVDGLVTDVATLKTGQATLVKKVDGLVTDVATLKTGQATLVKKVDGIEKTTGGLVTQMDGLVKMMDESLVLVGFLAEATTRNHMTRTSMREPRLVDASCVMHVMKLVTRPDPDGHTGSDGIVDQLAMHAPFAALQQARRCIEVAKEEEETKLQRELSDVVDAVSTPAAGEGGDAVPAHLAVDDTTRVQALRAVLAAQTSSWLPQVLRNSCELTLELIDVAMAAQRGNAHAFLLQSLVHRPVGLFVATHMISSFLHTPTDARGSTALRIHGLEPVIVNDGSIGMCVTDMKLLRPAGMDAQLQLLLLAWVHHAVMKHSKSPAHQPMKMKYWLHADVVTLPHKAESTGSYESVQMPFATPRGPRAHAECKCHFSWSGKSINQHFST